MRLVCKNVSASGRPHPAGQDVTRGPLPRPAPMAPADVASPPHQLLRAVSHVSHTQPHVSHMQPHREMRNEERETKNDKLDGVVTLPPRNEKRETRNEKRYRSIVRSLMTPISTPTCRQISPFLRATLYPAADWS